MTPPEDGNLAVIAHRLGTIDQQLATLSGKLEPLVIEREVERLRLAELARRVAEHEDKMDKVTARVEKHERKWVAVAGLAAGVGGGTSGILALLWKAISGGGGP